MPLAARSRDVRCCVVTKASSWTALSGVSFLGKESVLKQKKLELEVRLTGDRPFLSVREVPVRIPILRFQTCMYNSFRGFVSIPRRPV